MFMNTCSQVRCATPFVCLGWRRAWRSLYFRSRITMGFHLAKACFVVNLLRALQRVSRTRPRLSSVQSVYLVTSRMKRLCPSAARVLSSTSSISLSRRYRTETNIPANRQVYILGAGGDGNSLQLKWQGSYNLITSGELKYYQCASRASNVGFISSDLREAHRKA